MHLLFPSDPFNKSIPDAAYAEELAASQELGLACSVFSFEDFEQGVFKPRPALPAEGEILYRGWMLRPESYELLNTAVLAKGSLLKVSPAQYRHCHHLPEWYPLCQDITPETVVVPRDADFAQALADKGWPAYFVKDYVKSLTTGRGSVVASAQEVAEVVLLIEQYRGSMEGGVCIHRFESLLAESEERYFVLDGKAHAREGSAPALVHALARRIQSPFFSADLVLSATGDLRLFELGDGQVSNRKQWPALRFASMLCEARAPAATSKQ